MHRAPAVFSRVCGREMVFQRGKERDCMSDSFVCLPFRAAFTARAALIARKKARKNLLSWSAERLPVIHADADEPFDVNETVGSPTAPHNLLVGEPHECLGFACPNKSDACDDCEMNKMLDEILGE